jgi:phosphonopyruvate decarboxylase
MIEASALVAALAHEGCGPFVGVPCSLLAPLFAELSDGRVLIATDEGEAVGIAAGLYLAGRQPVVLMQNAGLLNALNPLLTLHAVFALPLLLVVSHRGEPGTVDAPEHEHTGRLTVPLLDLVGISHEALPTEQSAPLAEIAGRAAAALAAGRRHALLVGRGTFADHGPRASNRPAPMLPTGATVPTVPLGTLRRRDTLAAAFAHFPDAVFVASTGFIAREAVAAGEAARACVFPVIGSLGCAAPVGLGLAVAAPRRQVVVLDGDGALWMKLGVVASVASQAPRNLAHVVLNDGCYASTGGQPTAGAGIGLAGLARAAGYATAVRVATAAELDRALTAAAHVAGPHLIEVATTREPTTEAPRAGVTPPAYARSLRALRLCE